MDNKIRKNLNPIVIIDCVKWLLYSHARRMFGANSNSFLNIRFSTFEQSITENRYKIDQDPINFLSLLCQNSVTRTFLE